MSTAVDALHGWDVSGELRPGDIWTADIDGIRISGVVPAPIGLLSDQILVKCLPDDERMHGQCRILLPPNVDRGYLAIKTGIVVALGCGDVVAVRCKECEGGYVNHEVGGTGCSESMPCDDCLGTGFLPDPERTKFTVRPGDRVLYHPRDWAEWNYEGQQFVILHEDQHVLGVLTEDACVFTENQSTKSKGVDFDGSARLTNFSKGAA